MSTRFINGSPRGETLAIFAFEGETSKLGRAARDENFRAGDKELLVHYPGHPAHRVIVAGLGKKERFNPEMLRRAAGSIAARARALGLREISVQPPPGEPSEHTRAVVEGMALALYAFNARKPLKLTTVRVDGPAEAVRLGSVYARAACLARDLINEAPSDCTPRRMATKARSLARRGLRVKIFGEQEIRRMKMGGVLGVTAGSAEPPRFVHLSYRARGALKTIALVGKGVTFDSGGLCIKPADAMLHMKDDMSGAAAVLGVLSALPELKPRVNVHGIFAACENMPGAKAYKTRDVLRAMNGKTMEIFHTDAEGRLILADALSYASRLKPDEIIDIATLTGACVVALGTEISALFTKEDRLQRRLLDASTREGEKLWPLPLEEEYRELIKSDVADVKNSGGRYGGAITAALFLREFVDEKIPWAHLDIAGAAMVESNKPCRPAGGTGVMVRSLLRYLEGVR